MDTRSPEQVEAAAQRDAELVRLKREGKTFEEIGQQFGFSRQYAHKRYWELVRELREQTTADVADYRDEQLDRYEWLIRETTAILRRDHVHVSQGRVVRETPDSPPLLDDGPKLAAIRELRQIE